MVMSALMLTSKKSLWTVQRNAELSREMWRISGFFFFSHVTGGRMSSVRTMFHLLIGIFLDEHFSNANHFLLPFPLLKTILRARLIRLCMFSLLLSSDQPRQNFFWKENWFSHLSSSLTFSVPSSNDLWGGHLKALISLVNDPILTKKQFPVAKPNS